MFPCREGGCAVVLAQGTEAGVSWRPHQGFFCCLFERERERERDREEGRSRERGSERIPSRLHAVSAKPDVGLDLTNHEQNRTRAEIRSQALNRPRRPGAP